jgi:hypothetical protein
MPVILAPREVEIRRMEVRGQLEQKVSETSSESIKAGLGGHTGLWSRHKCKPYL